MPLKVLLISKVYTHPMTMGNSKAVLEQANILVQLGCEIDFLFVQERGMSKGQVDEANIIYKQMKDYWGEHFLHLNVNMTEKIFKNLLSYYRKYICGNHEGTYDRYPLRLTNYVKNLRLQKQYDVCLVQYYYLTKLFKKVKFSKMACFTHDVFAYKNILVNDRCPWIDASQEASALQLCTDVLAIQEEEKNYYHILSPRSRTYNVYSPYSFIETPYVGNHNIVFLSGNNRFNQNGLHWFIKEVLPLIRELYNDAKLIIAGGICNVINGMYDNVDGVELIGYVDNPFDLYKLGDVAINPTYQGTGLKIKTFEAISYGKVTLVHPHSMAGIYMRNNAPIFSSDMPVEWVGYLNKVWNEYKEVEYIKEKDKEYIDSMMDYIVQQYKQFLNL